MRGPYGGFGGPCQMLGPYDRPCTRVGYTGSNYNNDWKKRCQD